MMTSYSWKMGWMEAIQEEARMTQYEHCGDLEFNGLLAEWVMPRRSLLDFLFKANLKHVLRLRRRKRVAEGWWIGEPDSWLSEDSRPLPLKGFEEEWCVW